MALLPISEITPIDSAEKITLAGSSVPIIINNPYVGSLLTSVTIDVYIWRGQLDSSINPTITLTKKPVSYDDQYIKFELTEILKSHLMSPDSNGINYPLFQYGGFAGPNDYEGEGLFYQVKYSVYTDLDGNPDSLLDQYLPTKFATLGYRWNYEGILENHNGALPGGSLGYLTDIDPNTGELAKYYDAWMSNYFATSFNFSNDKTGVTSENLILRGQVVPSSYNTFKAVDPYMIVYLNKLGLWETFTPFGKVSVSTSMESETSPRMYRNQLNQSSTRLHAVERDQVKATQNYNINTGYLTETMTQNFEEILYSPKVYLIKFNGDTNVHSTIIKYTADSLDITADDTDITADATYTGSLTTYYRSFQQIPVVVKDSDFVRRTRVNDKTQINYTLMLEETRSKINNIR